MTVIKECRGLSDRQAFFSFSKKMGYRPAERRYIRSYLRTGGPRAVMLLAVRSGRAVGRLYTWQGADGHGYFALAEGEREALHLLLEGMEAFHKKLGSRDIFGPVFPDGAGVFTGTCAEYAGGGRGLFVSLSDTTAAEELEKAGFAAEECYDSYSVRVPRQNEYALLARRASERFGVKLRVLSHGLFGMSAADAVFSVDLQGADAAARNAEKLKGVFLRGACAAAVDRDGQVIGYVLCARGEPVRVMTIITKDVPLRPCAVLLLASFVTDELIKRGAETAELSVINEKNGASSAFAEQLNGVKKGRYVEYYKKLT